jgi:hypothetical protein
VSRILLLASLLLALPRSARGAEGGAGASPPDLTVRPPHPDDTHCERCHTTDGWTKVAFAHERTGFALAGAHERVSCKACHRLDFKTALGRECGSCHRDVHEGRLGARCTSCHDAETWVSRFGADAHERTNFPLTGRHAFIPCEECHGDVRDRGFTRATPTCYGCHQQDYERTRGMTVDHVANSFSTSCAQCHLPFRFTGAAYPAHDVCFTITSGPHAFIPCLSCHVSLASATITGQCATGTAACERCHACGGHPQVAGFACAERKCYECHQFTAQSRARTPSLKPR